MAILPSDPIRRARIDAGLSLLLLIQGLTLFAAIPLSQTHPAGRMLLDLCHIGYAVVSIALLSRHRAIRLLLVAMLVLVVAGPVIARRFGPALALSVTGQHEAIALAAFAFNTAITVLIARHVFAGGRVTAHRVRGAVLLYLNVAALFAIAYGLIAFVVPGAFALTVTGAATGVRAVTAEFSYFSLTTITTTGYGDIVPVHPLARTLANLENVFGQLFPATLLARLVALHLAHSEGADQPARPSS